MKKITSLLLSIAILISFSAPSFAQNPKYDWKTCTDLYTQYQAKYTGKTAPDFYDKYPGCVPAGTGSTTTQTQGGLTYTQLLLKMVSSAQFQVTRYAKSIGEALTAIFLSVAGIKIMLGDGLKLAEVIKILITYATLFNLVTFGPFAIQHIYTAGINIGQDVTRDTMSNLKTNMSAASVMGIAGAKIAQYLPTQVAYDSGSIINATWASFTQAINKIFNEMKPVSAGHDIAGVIAVLMNLPNLLYGFVLMLCIFAVAVVCLLEGLFIYLDNIIILAFSPLVFAIAIAEQYRSLIPNLISAILKLALKSMVVYVALGGYYIVLALITETIVQNSPAQALTLGIFCIFYAFVVWHAPRVVDGLFPGSPPSGAKAFGMAAITLGTEMAVGAAAGGVGNLLGAGGLRNGLSGALKGGLQPLGQHVAKKAGVNIPGGGGGPSAGKQGGKDDKHGAEIAKNSSTVSSGWEKADNIPGPSQAASLSKVDMGGGKAQEVVAPPPTQFAPSSSVPSSPSASSAPSSGPSVSSSSSGPSVPKNNSSSQQPSSASSSSPPPSDTKKGQ